MAAPKKSRKENGAKAVVEHKQGSQHPRLLDSPFRTTTTPKKRTVRGDFTVDSESVGLEAASSSAVNPVVHVPPTDVDGAFNAVSADAKPAPAKATRSKKAKSKTTAKTRAKGQTEQTTLTQMDVETRVDVPSIDKAQQEAIAAQVEAANNAGSGGRGASWLKRKPKAPAVTIPRLPGGPAVQSRRLNGRTCQLCFFESCFYFYFAALTMSAGLPGYHTVHFLTTVKHTVIMTRVPELPETSVRFFPVTALLCDDLLHSFVQKCTILDSAFVFHRT